MGAPGPVKVVLAILGDSMMVNCYLVKATIFSSHTRSFLLVSNTLCLEHRRQVNQLTLWGHCPLTTPLCPKVSLRGRVSKGKGWPKESRGAGSELLLFSFWGRQWDPFASLSSHLKGNSSPESGGSSQLLEASHPAVSVYASLSFSDWKIIREDAIPEGLLKSL